MQTEASQRLGSKLMLIRNSKGLTLEELAKALGYPSKGNFSNFENGNRIPSDAVLKAYSKHLGADLQELRDLRAAALAEQKEERRAAAQAPDEARDHAESLDDHPPDETGMHAVCEQFVGIPTPGPEGDRRRARRTRRAATLAVGVLVLVLVLVLVTLLHKSTSPPRPVKRADATRLVGQYIARFRAEDLRGVIATLAPSPKIIDRTQAALTDETTTTTGLNEVRGEYRATFAIGDLSDRRERVVDSRVGVAATIVDTKWTDALTRRNIGPRSQGITSYEVVAVDGVPRIATVRERSLVAFPFAP